MASVVNTISALRESPAPTGAALVALVTAALVLYVEEARTHEDQQRHERTHPAVMAARALVQQELHNRLTLRDLAAAAHIAPEYLVRLFRKQLGTTPIRYLWRERTRLGVYLLEHTGLPVAEIAARTGFQTPKHFAQHVRAATGRSPRELRLFHWSTPPAPDADR
jgi:transcriptional regulator GlxA family with amidase domain